MYQLGSLSISQQVSPSWSLGLHLRATLESLVRCPYSTE